MTPQAKKDLMRNSKYSSRLTSKYQVKIPKEIREHLHLKSGDEISYERLPDKAVIIRKISLLDLDYLEALNTTLNEWESEEDEHSYRNL